MLFGIYLTRLSYWKLGSKTLVIELGTWEEIKTIDSTGHFEADDEVGSIFTSIKQTIEELNQYIEEDTTKERKRFTKILFHTKN